MFNDDLISEGVGWKTTADSNLTAARVTANILIVYLRYSNFFEDNFNESFFEGHPVAIIATAFLSVSLLVAAIIKQSTRDSWKVLNKNESI